MDGRQSTQAGHSASRRGAPIRAPRFFSPAACAGFNLIELIAVITVLAIVGYFTVRTFQPKAVRLDQSSVLRSLHQCSAGTVYMAGCVSLLGPP